MGFSQFHFAQGAWLWGLIAIPLVLLLYVFFQSPTGADRLERFADRHLLPHLIKNSAATRANVRRPLLLWSLAWLCGVIALAGPRWGYTEEQTYEPARDLVVVLDLSQSMNATDVKPSRIARAREEIEDIMNMSHDDSIGLVAYAAVPHMVTPLTDDFRTIKNLLPELDTSLVTIEGDRLKPALRMAASMLKDEVGDDKSILVISDGNFQEDDIADLAQAAGSATIYTMGVGLPNSGLRADRLQMLATAGRGIYVEANYTDSDTRAILNRMGVANFRARMSGKGVRVWDERFYIPALILALLLLPLFRKGASFPVILLLSAILVPLGNAKANTASDWFMNRNQQAKAAYDGGDYKGAETKFDTSYQRGVAAYRAKQYDKAALLFQAAAREKARLNALYDLGNAQLMQDQVEDAVASYKAALRQKPDDVATLHNLAIALKMLEQKQQKQNQQNKGGNGGGQNKQSGQQQAGQQRKDGSQKPQRGAQTSPKPSSQQPVQPKGDQKTAQQKQGQPKQGNLAGSDAKQSTASRSAQSQGGKQIPPQNSQYGMAAAAPPRTQRDINADQWLIRIPSDPGSFLKNQFAIEDQKSGSQQGAPPR
jgi:Ca-activated chloride channel family protein